MPKNSDITIKQFKDKSSFWWVGYKCYHLNKDGVVEFIVGGYDTKEEREAIESFIKRNNKKFVPREESLTQESYTLDFGKYKDYTLEEVKKKDSQYLRWLLENTNKEELKTEIKKIL